MTVSAARQVALEVLTRVRERSAYAHETLDAVLTGKSMEDRDRGLATRLAYGAVATRGTLDDAVVRACRPGTALEPRVADALALGAYEVLFAETASHAAVSETVELVRSVNPRAAGLANAVMRKLSTLAQDFPWGDASTDVGALARLHGHPEWIARMWVEELGWERAAQVMAANNQPAPLFLACLPNGTEGCGPVEADLREQGVQLEPGPLDGSWTVANPAAARKAPAIAQRVVLVMDAGAQFAVHAAVPESGRSLVEIGAGRGGKTLLLAALAGSAGDEPLSVVAVDTHAFKLDALTRDAERLGIEGVTTVVADATDITDVPSLPAASFDVVLVDAPCSGLGTLRRHPDRRWRATPAEIDSLATLGRRMLGSAARLVKPGGFVVYSTCTIARRENDDVIEGFVGSSHGAGFDISSLRDVAPAQWESFVTPQGWFQSLPAIGGADGHFVARLVRRT